MPTQVAATQTPPFPIPPVTEVRASQTECRPAPPKVEEQATQTDPEQLQPPQPTSSSPPTEDAALPGAPVQDFKYFYELALEREERARAKKTRRMMEDIERIKENPLVLFQ